MKTYLNLIKDQILAFEYFHILQADFLLDSSVSYLALSTPEDSSILLGFVHIYSAPTSLNSWSSMLKPLIYLSRGVNCTLRMHISETLRYFPP